MFHSLMRRYLIKIGVIGVQYMYKAFVPAVFRLNTFVNTYSKKVFIFQKRCSVRTVFLLSARSECIRDCMVSLPENNHSNRRRRATHPHPWHRLSCGGRTCRRLSLCRSSGTASRMSTPYSLFPSSFFWSVFLPGFFFGSSLFRIILNI